MKRYTQAIGLTILWIVALLGAAWAAGALYFDFPWAGLRVVAALSFGVAMTAAVVMLRGWWRKVLALVGGFVMVLAWWLTLQPGNDRHWLPDVARPGWAEINGDEVTLHNVRNFDYQTETDFTPRWETRTVRISQLTGVDIAINYWGSQWMAHPIASFQFADAPPVCFSIETRKEIGESYSALGGFYRQFELIYIVANERDVIRVRTNYRQGEDVYLYRLISSLEETQASFLEYLKAMNAIHEDARWYNAITTNCTTSIRHQRDASRRSPWDWRLLLNGKSDEMMFERGAIVTRGLPFAELKARSHINSAAKESDHDPDFSKRIRQNLPFATSR